MYNLGNMIIQDPVYLLGVLCLGSFCSTIELHPRQLAEDKYQVSDLYCEYHDFLVFMSEGKTGNSVSCTLIPAIRMPISKATPYIATTRQIRVTVRPVYLDDQSAPSDNHFVWAYHVTIENLGSETVQLLSRHWRITDARGELHEVRGPGVIGEQPVLEPGDTYEYTSGTPLATPSGIMDGAYQMENERGEMFDIAIPAFSLDSPYQPVRLN